MLLPWSGTNCLSRYSLQFFTSVLRPFARGLDVYRKLHSGTGLTVIRLPMFAMIAQAVRSFLK